MVSGIKIEKVHLTGDGGLSWVSYVITFYVSTKPLECMMSSPIPRAPEASPSTADTADRNTAYRPSTDEPYMSPGQLNHFRCKLMDWRQSLIDERDETLRQLRDQTHREVGDEIDRAARETDQALELRTRDRCRKLSCCTRLTRRWPASTTAPTATARRPASPSAWHGWKRGRSQPSPSRPRSGESCASAGDAPCESESASCAGVGATSDALPH
jgi:RNA polymerase-binding transcription factor DksA